MRLLLGRPVMETFEERRQERLAVTKLLPTQVYVPIECLERGKTEPFFQESAENPNRPLMQKMQAFLEGGLGEEKVLLIHGAAGSGKSTFAKKIE